MNSLTKALLSGAALCALAATPALASVHLAISNGHNPLVLANGSTHYKSAFAPAKYTNVTQTATFTYTGAESTMYHKSVLLGHGDGWITVTANEPGVCQTIPGQKARAKSRNAKIKAYSYKTHITVASTTGGFPGCTGTVTQYEPDYKLTNKNLSQDKFVFTIDRKKWTTSGGNKYNLKLNENWTVNID